MPVKPSWKDDIAMFALGVLFLVTVMVTIYLEHFFHEDGVIVNWGMGMSLAFMGALIQLITGKAREYKIDNSGRITENTVNLAPDPPKAP